MAASSSTAANSNYDVFISHRGPDVKKGFASHLYRRINLTGLRAFLDQPELERGEDFRTQIKNVITSASVHVAIFSVGYADSYWCLNELVQMLKSGAPIIPVFYHVNPSELRRTGSGKGRYAEALHKLEWKTKYDPQTHQERFRYHPSMIEIWRNALDKAACISGCELEACNGDEGELVDRVVQAVLKKVRKLDVAKYPTGLDGKINDFERTVLLPLQQSGKPQILGIVGLGGVGKTTFAKEFFNRNCSDYGESCFLANVKDTADKVPLNSLQRILLNTLTGSDAVINSVAEGTGMLQSPLLSSKALIILDDVDDVNQVDALLPFPTVLYSHSLILITSRNKDVLIRSRVQESSIYHLTGLDPHHSWELFCNHAFHQPYPLRGFGHLVQSFIQICDGLPLSLEVFGARLYGKEEFYWEEELESLEQMLPHEIQLRLKRSYESLGRAEQNIFLDIACFFIGQNKDKAIRIWKGSGWPGRKGFQNLRDKCVVDVDSNDDIQMHGHFRDIGRYIADSERPHRLWRSTKNTIDMLEETSPVGAVRGIRMVVSENDDALGGMDDALGGIGMKRLQLLDSEDVLVEHIWTKVQSPDLIWLRWNNCPYPSLPTVISMTNLRVLEVQGALKTLWENESQAPLQLRELNIDGPLSIIPKSIGLLKHLKRIVIGPRGMGIPFQARPSKSLVAGPSKSSEPSKSSVAGPSKSSVSLSSPFPAGPSESLVFGSGPEMESLPEGFGDLTNLRHIQLSQCFALERMPESFGNLINLEHIQLFQCSALERLPESFGNLINLEHIQLFQCSALATLPDSFGNLWKLHHIQLSGCSALQGLPDSFAKLIHLQSLDLEDCINLNMSSETLVNFSRLEYLNLSGCRKIELLPQQVAHQRSLKQLHLGGMNLKELPSTIAEQGDLKVLVVGGPVLNRLPPSLERLPQLTELTVKDCPLIRELPWTDLDSSSKFQSLQKLHVSGTGISEISFAEGDCLNLRALTITDCNNVVKVGTLPKRLIDLSLARCHNLRNIDTVNGLAKLQTLNISNCIKLLELPGIETLVSLSELNASGCVKLKSIRGVGQLTKFQQLFVRGCSELEVVEGIQHCVSLWRLDVEECPKLQRGAEVVQQLHQRNTEQSTKRAEPLAREKSGHKPLTSERARAGRSPGKGVGEREAGRSPGKGVGEKEASAARKKLPPASEKEASARSSGRAGRSPGKGVGEREAGRSPGKGVGEKEASARERERKRRAEREVKLAEALGRAERERAEALGKKEASVRSSRRAGRSPGKGVGEREAGRSPGKGVGEKEASARERERKRRAEREVKLAEALGRAERERAEALGKALAREKRVEALGRALGWRSPGKGVGEREAGREAGKGCGEREAGREAGRSLGMAKPWEGRWRERSG